MYYVRDTQNDSPYVSINTLIQPKKSGAPSQASHAMPEISNPGEPAEIEADRIADQVTAPESTGYRSPALEMRSQIRSSSCLDQPQSVIQRAVNTSGGTWDTEDYQEAKNLDGNNQKMPSYEGMRGVNITLKFTPGANTNAERIGLIQTAQSITDNSPSYLSDTHANRSITKQNAKTVDGVSEEGVHIDRGSENRNPIYAVMPTDSASLDDPTTTDKSGGMRGEHGWHYKDEKGGLQEHEAVLYDTPRLKKAFFRSAQIFETTALATKGVDAGSYYGSVRWGWQTDAKGDFQKIDLKKVAEGIPSSTFIKAAKLWNTSETSTGEKTIPLPLGEKKDIPTSTPAAKKKSWFSCWCG